METQNKGRNRKSKIEHATWPWLRVDLGTGHQQIYGRYNGQLSPHILNLRATQILPEGGNEPTKVERHISQAIDFAHTTITFDEFVPKPLLEILNKYNNLKRLSVITVLDIPWCIIGTIFSLITYSYILMYYRLRPIGGAVIYDFSNFLEYTSRIVNFGKLLNMHEVATAPIQVSTARLAFSSASWFALVALLVIIPIKGISSLNEANARQAAMIKQATDGAFSLQAASNLFADGEIAEAQQHLIEAARQFDSARAQLGNTSERFLRLMDAIPGVPAKVSSASRLLTISSELSQAAANAASAWSTSSLAASPDEALAALEIGAISVQPHVRESLQQLREVDPALVPESIRDQLSTIQQEIDQIEQGLSNAFELPVFLKNLAGGLTAKRYLVLFQNPSELRATGGFAGSLAFVELRNGVVTELEVPGGGPYDFQGGLKRIIRPPEPIRISRGTWQLQDAAWFFDFPTSARKVLWFLRESGGPEVDGVIAINAEVAASLLGLTGPIALPEYKKVLTRENFVRETQEAVELEFDVVANRPKQFIADLAPELLSRIISLRGAQQLELISLLDNALAERSIQIYLTEPDLQAKARSFGWAGEVHAAPMDYLAIVRSNIGGGKTDAVTDDSIDYKVEVLPSGQLIAHLKLTREHKGDPRDVFEWRRNQSYLRIFVPQGSKLMSAIGFTTPPAEHLQEVPQNAEIDEDLTRVEQSPTVDTETGVRVTQEFGKTVFGQWLNVMPGESRTVTLTYSLPFSLTASGGVQDLRRYALYVQKQSGLRNVNFRASLQLPEGWRVRWQESSSELSQQDGKIEVSSDLRLDMSYGVLLERK